MIIKKCLHCLTHHHTTKEHEEFLKNEKSKKT